MHGGRTELWHTRLTQTTNGIGPDPDTKVRAIWSPDYPLDTPEILDAVNAVPPKPFRMSLDPLDRQMLVKLMAGFNEKDDLQSHASSRTRRRRGGSRLSSLGALLDAAGDWVQLPAGVSLEQWRHLANLGRDHYVRVVYRGSLCHPGNSTSLIKVTERKFEWMDKTNKTGRVALLRQRFFLVVRQPVVVTAGAGHAFQGRNFPFTQGRDPHARDAKPAGARPGRDAAGRSERHDLRRERDSEPRVLLADARRQPTTSCSRSPSPTSRGERTTFSMPLLFVGVEANSKPAVHGRDHQAVQPRGQSRRGAPRRWAAHRSATRRSKPDRKAIRACRRPT